MALQCDIAHELAKASIPPKANATSVTIKSEPKPPSIEEKPKEKKDDSTSEMSLEANEKMLIDDDVTDSVESKNDEYVQ